MDFTAENIGFEPMDRINGHALAVRSNNRSGNSPIFVGTPGFEPGLHRYQQCVLTNLDDAPIQLLKQVVLLRMFYYGRHFLTPGHFLFILVICGLGEIRTHDLLINSQLH